jgi:hypothetical protein
MSFKPAFHEDFTSEHLDPLDGQTIDFDFESVYAALGEATEDLGREQRAELARAMRVLLAWIVRVDLNESKAPNPLGLEQKCGRRAICMAWVISPDLFDGISLTELAMRLGYTKPVLSVITSAFSREFNVRNRGQSHGIRKKALLRPNASDCDPIQENSGHA